MTEDLLKRKFNIEVAEIDGDGRTIHALVVPYGKPATVNDGYGPYKEQFIKGAFERAVNVPNRVWLNFEHHPGFSNVIGNGVHFEERTDGLYGQLEVDTGDEGDKALRFINKRVLTGMSVEFKPMSKDANVDGVVTRRSVHLDAVALCRVGAYQDAQVLAVRTESVAKQAQPKPFDAELAQKLARFVEVPTAFKQVRCVMEDGTEFLWHAEIDAKDAQAIVADLKGGRPKA